jgi:hypothetical protein
MLIHLDITHMYQFFENERHVIFNIQEGRDLVQHAILVGYGKAVPSTGNIDVEGDDEEEVEVGEDDYHEDDDHFEDMDNFIKSSMATDSNINTTVSNKYDIIQEEVKDNLKRPRETAFSQSVDDSVDHDHGVFNQADENQPEPHITHKQKRLMKRQKTLEDAVLSPEVNSKEVDSMVQDPFFNETVVVTKNTLTGKIDVKNKNKDPNRCGDNHLLTCQCDLRYHRPDVVIA